MLNKEGIKINHKTVYKIYVKFNLQAKVKRRKYVSYKGNVGKVAPNLVNRDFKADLPNQKWTTDVTQFNCPFGKAYLSPILDMFNGEIVSYNLSLSPNFEQVSDMFNQAISKNKNVKGLIFHSDQGWQYQNPRWQNMLKINSIIQSMSRKGNCLDNGIMESFFGVLKNEMFYGFENEFQTFNDLKRAIDEYILFYNTKRLKSRTDYMSPIDYKIKKLAELKLN